MASSLRLTRIVEATGDVDPGPVAPPALLLAAAELARELAISVKTVRRLDASGRLPRPVRVGHAVRWPRATIEAWLAAGCPDREEWELYHGPAAARGRRP